MGAIGTIILGLILVNGLLLLIIAMVLLDNPFKLEVMLTLLVTNALVFLLAAVLTADSPLAALMAFGMKLLPYAVLGCGLLLLFLVQARPRPARRPR